MMNANSVDTDGKWVYRVGGISAIVFGIAYIAIMALYLPLGGVPTGVEAWFAQTSTHTTEWWAILGLSVLTDFLLVPIALAVYLALKGINRNAMLLAVAFMGLFVVLDLALTWTNIAALIILSGGYAAASSEAQRAAFLTAAIYPSTIIETNLTFIYNSLTLAVGILLTGLVMFKGIFSKASAYIALATGALGIVAVTSSFFSNSVSSVAIILAAVLTTVWVFFVGFKLNRLSRR